MFDRGFTFLGVHFQGEEVTYTVDDVRIEVDDRIPDWWYARPEGY